MIIRYCKRKRHMENFANHDEYTACYEQSDHPKQYFKWKVKIMLNPEKYVVLQQERRKEVRYTRYNKECKVKHRGSLSVMQVEKSCDSMEKI